MCSQNILKIKKIFCQFLILQGYFFVINLTLNPASNPFIVSFKVELLVLHPLLKIYLKNSKILLKLTHFSVHFGIFCHYFQKYFSPHILKDFEVEHFQCKEINVQVYLTLDF